MRGTVALSVCVLLLVSCGTGKKAVVEASELQAPIVRENPVDVSPDRLIIMVDEEIGKDPLKDAIKKYGAEILYDYSIIAGMAIKIPEGKDIQDAIKYFKEVKGVVSVERDHIYHLIDPVKPRLYDR
jgi:hypothetical protein